MALNIPKTGVNAWTEAELDEWRLKQYEAGKTIEQVEAELAQMRQADANEAAYQYAQDTVAQRRQAAFDASNGEIRQQREDQQERSMMPWEGPPGWINFAGGYSRKMEPGETVADAVEKRRAELGIPATKRSPFARNDQ